MLVLVAELSLASSLMALMPVVLTVFIDLSESAMTDILVNSVSKALFSVSDLSSVLLFAAVFIVSDFNFNLIKVIFVAMLEYNFLFSLHFFSQQTCFYEVSFSVFVLILSLTFTGFDFDS